MHLLSYEAAGQQRVGILTADKQSVIPLIMAEQRYFGTTGVGLTMLDVIQQGEPALQRIRTIIEKAKTDTDCPSIPLSSVKISAPIERPPKNIFCIGKNYTEHALEFDKTKDANIAVPKHPVVFTKAATAIIGHQDVIHSHSDVTSELDYEVELAVIIGKQGYKISAEDAMDYIFGYTIINDITARDLQKKHLQWFLGKSLDTFAPMGPYLVHKSALPHPDCLSIRSKVNGEIRQDANTKDLVFSIPTLIATISAGITLEPGDIIATGTPAGVGAGFNPPKFLQPGDELELEIEGIGILKNRVE
ncbi:5-carboxymethyl-2-hydroxymuconate isomerase [Anaerosporomusa subterranea]|uniref:5-carboxymethyl-2-hydroxymuconate isomerase n=1 Tax=Anaerosporomusa subterranea TaxID=1794912 RepID=A0A154BVS5_ANASB|nr:fumarylacetoacetate hydrolase family protein [Anaerosporomusa subterranea]KYZ78123.1 5-carboxymethyl-2-hydroxymuconate isomerase [Anaerosporomusa subterranea]